MQQSRSIPGLSLVQGRGKLVGRKILDVMLGLCSLGIKTIMDVFHSIRK